MSAMPSDAALPATPARRRLHRWSLLFFVCGMLTGAGLAVIGLHAFMTYRFNHPEQQYMRIIDRGVKGLDLTPEQRRRVDDIARRQEAALSAIFTQELRPRVDAHFDALREAVASVLNEQQAAEWKRRFDEIRAQSIPPFPPPPRRATEPR